MPGFPNVIAFTGYKWRDADNPKSGEISRGDGADNCVKGFREIVGHAEKRGVTICLEHLNTRDTSHPMKGHPGYQGDDLDWVARASFAGSSSPRLKLLFDIYHVQIMHGDVIRRIEQNRDIIGHVHTAGNPGRANWTIGRRSSTRRSCESCWTSSTRATSARNSSQPATRWRDCGRRSAFATCRQERFQPGISWGAPLVWMDGGFFHHRGTETQRRQKWSLLSSLCLCASVVQFFCPPDSQVAFDLVTN